ncbi:MAG: hypothetical protein LBT24_07490 [Tannerella sp.]|jgi:hypothetical protein|nr:hypothetical protein [Tannerella sp.]
MGLNYDFYENPQAKGGEEKKILHARVVSKGSMTTDALAQVLVNIQLAIDAEMNLGGFV